MSNDITEIVRRIGNIERRLESLPLPSVPSGGAVGDHRLLNGGIHTDTAEQTPTRGSLVYVPPAGAWDELAHPGGAGRVLTTDAADVQWTATPTWSGLHKFDANLSLVDSGGDHYVEFDIGEDNGADRTLTLTLNDGDRSLTLEGDLTVEAASRINQDVTTDASPTFADVFVPDGGQIGISGNELLTFTAAGNVTVSGADLALSTGLGITHADGNTAGNVLRADGTRYIPSTLAMTDLSSTSLTDPGADRIVFWDDSDSQFEFLIANNGIEISGNNLNLTTPGTLTAATGNSAAGNHTHAVTTSSDGTSDPSTIAVFNASGQLTAEDFFVPDGGQIGISGNELLTFNAAGNATFSGVTSVVMPDGAWVGADSDCAWVFDSTNGDVTTRDNVGIGTASPDSYKLNVAGSLFAREADIRKNTTGASQNLLSIQGVPATNEWLGIALGNTTAQKAGIIYERTGGNGLGKLHLALNTTNDTSEVALADSLVTLADGNVGINETVPDTRLHAVDEDTSTNSVVEIIRATHQLEAGSTAANGIGASIGFELEDDGGGLDKLAEIQAVATDVSAGAEHGAIVWMTADIGDDGLAERLRLDHDGILDFDGSDYGDGSEDPTTDAPADWIEVKLGGTQYFIPLYT